MEEYLVVAFRSRTHTMRFYESLVRLRVKCKVINTPREIGVGCGVSVKAPTAAAGACKMLLMRTNYSTFIGLYLANNKNGSITLKQI